MTASATPEQRAREIVLSHDKKWGTFYQHGMDIPPAQDLAAIITAAISAAVDAERESCERIAHDEAAKRKRVADALEGAFLEVAAQLTGQEAAQNIEAAIRDRARKDKP
jgi:hypothetical protein